VSDSDDPRAGGWRFFLWWMLAFLGFPLGGLLALVVVGAMEGLVPVRWAEPWLVR
jgi:hypothetical protein